MMGVITHELEAKCPPDKIWSILADLVAVELYNPTVKAARIKGEKARGVGAQRECDLLPRGKVTERVTEWTEGRALGIEIVESDWPVTFMRWVTRIEPHGQSSVLTQRLDYRVKFGPLGMLLDALVMRRKIAANVESALRGLIRTAESTA